MIKSVSIATLFALACISLFSSCSTHPDLSLAGIDPGPGDASLKSSWYAVKINGADSFVYQNNKRPADSGPLKEVLLDSVSWTTLASDEPISVEVEFLKAPAPKSIIIRPKSLGIVAKLDGKRVRFTLPSGRKVTIEEEGNATNPLFIFGHPKDIDAASLPADTLIFKAGIHRTESSHIVLKSNQTVLLEPGAFLYGRFLAKNVENVRILGRGTVCGSYLERPKNMAIAGDYAEQGKLRLLTLNGANCEVSGPSFVDGPYWTTWIEGADASRLNKVSHVSIIGWYVNTDGFGDMKHTRAHDLFTCVNDDAFILNNTGDCEVERAVVWGMRAGAPLRLGWNGVDDLNHVIYRDIDVVHFNGQSVISLWHGGPSHVRGITIENVRVEGPMNMLISLRLASNPWSPKGRGLGKASDFIIRNIIADGPFAKPSEITGSPDHPIERISLENITINGKRATTLSDIPLKTNAHTADITLK